VSVNKHKEGEQNTKQIVQVQTDCTKQSVMADLIPACRFYKHVIN
jgi:hypothetical protein